ncbi:unnamed protein product [Linum trigynum]|uniref:Uncharacterized protein n=1 Tax=Linum trigynum TaxID=586398 RepID=A0AAV2G7L3_9ROSI
MGCVMSSSTSSEKKKNRGGSGRRRQRGNRPRWCYGGRDGRRSSAPSMKEHEEFHDRCHTIIVPQLVGRGGPGGYYNDRTTSYYEDSDDSSSVVAFAPWKGHRFVGQHRHQPNSPAMVSDSWSFAVGSPAMSLGSPVMFSEVWSKQGKRPTGGGGGGGGDYNNRHHQPAVIDEEATEIELELESEGEVSPFVGDFSSSPEREGKGNEVGVFARRRKNGSLSDPTFMEAFLFA